MRASLPGCDARGDGPVRWRRYRAFLRRPYQNRGTPTNTTIPEEPDTLPAKAATNSTNANDTLSWYFRIWGGNFPTLSGFFRKHLFHADAGRAVQLS